MRTFIIFSPSYDENIGGIIALHKLCDIINRQGERALLFPYFDTFEISRINYTEVTDFFQASGIFPESNKFYTNPDFLSPILTKIPKDGFEGEFIIVYPEITFGNPLNAKNVVRWLLHNPGFHTGKIYYGSGELYFKFHSSIKDFSFPGSRTSNSLLTAISYPLELYNKINVCENRNGTAYCLRKGSHKKVVHDVAESILIDGKSHTEIAGIFKRVRTFISYDTYTAYSIFAVLCGCDSVVVPDESVNEEEWCRTPSNVYGVAYGFENIEKARRDAPLLLESVRQQEEQSTVSVVNFITEANQFFSSLKGSPQRDFAKRNPEGNAASRQVSQQQRELQIIFKQLEISVAHVERLNEYIRQSNRRSLRRFIARVKRIGRSARPLGPSAATILFSPFFDANWYLEQYPDIAGSDMEPASHYADFGWQESRQPSALFDGPWYLDQNPDVAVAGVNPLIHYMHEGWTEGRAIRDLASGRMFEAPASSARPFRAKAPPWAEFEKLAADKGSALGRPPCVDVIVPVYRGYDETFACLGSILRSKNQTPFELIVIDDYSPEPEISHSLHKLAELGLITLIKNRCNVGFVGTVNHGMGLHLDRDILLLNSDTLVFNDWLDKLKMHASGDVATVTPFTNNGTICSYPVFFQDNVAELELSFEDLDHLAAATNKGSSVEVPTGVGFCIYIVRRALSEVGFFDEASFGKGYGEENDFCMRARRLGWRNIHALDTFVFHSGATSFSEGASERKDKAVARVCELHPEYPKIVQTYIERDPVRLARASLDLARLLQGRFPNAAVLYFTHSWGGGNQRYFRNRTRRLRKKGRDMILALPSAPGSNCVRLTHIDAKFQFHNLAAIDLKRDRNILKGLLSRLKTQNIEVHGRAGWPVQFLNAVEELAAECNLEWSFVAVGPIENDCPSV